MRKRWFFVVGAMLLLAGLWILEADPGKLIPGAGGRAVARDFLGSALRPAFDFEDEGMRESGASFASKLIRVTGLTIGYAMVAISLALVIGLVGGVLGSRSWWTRPSFARRILRASVRLLATALRSVHELMWALLFLSAVGTSPLAIVLAIALPFGGTLAKVFSELLDEQDQSTAEVIRATGGGGLAGLVAGVIPRALPDLSTYFLYRLECAIRSSAVMGFVGIPTIGYEITTAFQDGHYREIWTYLYLLWGVVIFLEWWGARIRKSLGKGVAAKAVRGPIDLASLWRARGTSRFLRGSLLLLIGAVMLGWTMTDRWDSGVRWQQRMAHLERFTDEIVPYPVREADGDWARFPSWLSEKLSTEGYEAISRTFHLATVAALLAGTLALGGIRFAARSLASPEHQSSHTWISKGTGMLLRGGAMVARAMPEFILAFLLLGVFGPTVWPLILALAIHNGGILLRLGSEVIDNLPEGSRAVIHAQGGSKSALVLASLLPESFNRLVLFLFYRWESCMREATVLGMLGILSLGSLISDARALFYYDEILLWVALGAVLVFVGDLTSDWVRSRLRGKAF